MKKYGFGAMPECWYVVMEGSGDRFCKRFYTEAEAQEYADEVAGTVTESLGNRSCMELW